MSPAINRISFAVATTCCLTFSNELFGDQYDSFVEKDEEETEMVNVTYVIDVDGDMWEKVGEVTGAEIATVQAVSKIKVSGVKFKREEIEYDTEDGYVVNLAEITKATKRQIARLTKAGFEKVGLVVDGKIKRT